MWGYFAAGLVAGAVGAWQWVTNVMRPVATGLPPAPPVAGLPLAPAPQPSQEDFRLTAEWASSFVPYRLPLPDKLRLIARQFGPLGWPSYAQRVGAWYGRA